MEAHIIVCNGCNKQIQTKDPKRCEICNHHYHTRCNSFRSVTVKAVATLACSGCAEALIKKRLESSLNGSNTTSKGTKKKTASAPPSTTSSRNQSPMRPPLSTVISEASLQNIFSALAEIRTKQDEAAEAHRAMTARIAGLEARLGPIELSLKALDDLPQLHARVTNTELAITELQAQLQDLSSGRLLPQPTSDNSSNSNNIPPAAADPQEIASLRRELAAIKHRQELSNNDVVVITGLHYTQESSLDLLAYSVLSALDPTVLRRDIAATRTMGRLNAATDTTAADSRLPPIAVTLSSHALVRSTIAAKIKRGKLHSSELDASLLEEARALAPDHQGLININELLPPEVHKLRVRARQEAKKRQGCRSFVRDGRIYIRSAEDKERATVITSDEDLADFLARRPLTNISSDNVIN